MSRRRGPIVLAVAIATGSLHSLPAQAPHPVARAAQLIGAGRQAAAIAVLDSFFTATPDAPVGWPLLGGALLATGQLDRAAVAYERGLAFPATRSRSLVGLGVTEALRHHLDSAFVLLGAARATGQVDLTQLAFDPHAAAIRNDPRYASLLPTPAEYDDPFEESVAILAEWRGEHGGDQFGWIARTVGDVDGDGRADVVTSAPTARNGAGAVYLLSSGTGRRLWQVDGSGGDELGTGVEAAGDVDGDGIPDVIAGAPGSEHALLLSGRDGRVIRRLDGTSPGERFGQRVSGLGDIDHDGRADVLVGAPNNSADADQAGRVYVISGATGVVMASFGGGQAGARLGEALDGAVAQGRILIVAGAPGLPNGGGVRVWTALDAPPAFTITPDSGAVQLGGMFVSVVGDVDGDGSEDIYASDWYDQSRGGLTGKVYVHSGATGQRLLSLVGERPGIGFGIGTAEAGDVDGDGHDDLIVGAWQFGGGAPSGGKLSLHSGRDGRLIGTVTDRVMGETLGFDATGVGDIDGDGVVDLLVTAAWSAVNGPRSGRVLILSGRDVLATGTSRSGPNH